MHYHCGSEKQFCALHQCLSDPSLKAPLGASDTRMGRISSLHTPLMAVFAAQFMPKSSGKCKYRKVVSLLFIGEPIYKGCFDEVNCRVKIQNALELLENSVNAAFQELLVQIVSNSRSDGLVSI